MGRLLISGILAGLLVAVLVASASHGMLSRIPDMSLKARLALLGCALSLVPAAWFYADGGFDYLIWAYRVPARPATERQFVSLVERAMGAWSRDVDGAARDGRCRSRMAEIEGLADRVSDWSGTVSTAYRLGNTAVLAMRIGRHTWLRTSYNAAPGATLIAAGSSTYRQALDLQPGDAVRFSGAAAGGAAGCLFERNRYNDEVTAALVFNFTALRSD
jgi:hypothetical protein